MDEQQLKQNIFNMIRPVQSGQYSFLPFNPTMPTRTPIEKPAMSTTPQPGMNFFPINNPLPNRIAPEKPPFMPGTNPFMPMPQQPPMRQPIQKPAMTRPAMSYMPVRDTGSRTMIGKRNPTNPNASFFNTQQSKFSRFGI